MGEDELRDRVKSDEELMRAVGVLADRFAGVDRVALLAAVEDNDVARIGKLLEIEDLSGLLSQIRQSAEEYQKLFPQLAEPQRWLP